MVAEQPLVNVHRGYVLFSMNLARGFGGTCYGDSGGPHFNAAGEIVAIITTGDIPCKSTDQASRTDTADALGFIAASHRPPDVPRAVRGSSPAVDHVGIGCRAGRRRPTIPARARRAYGPRGGARWGPAPSPARPPCCCSGRCRSPTPPPPRRPASGRCWPGSPSTPAGRSGSTAWSTTSGTRTHRPAPATRCRSTSRTCGAGSAGRRCSPSAAATGSRWHPTGSTPTSSSGWSRWRWASGPSGRARDAVATLDAGLRLWRGEAMSDLADYAFAVVEAARLRELRATALEHLAEALLETGDLDRLTGRLAPALRDFPFRDRLRAAVMTGLYRQGRAVDALALYAEVVDQLRAELGLEPGPTLTALQHAILNDSPDLAPGPGGRPPDRRADVPRDRPRRPGGAGGPARRAVRRRGADPARPPARDVHVAPRPHLRRGPRAVARRVPERRRRRPRSRRGAPGAGRPRLPRPVDGPGADRRAHRHPARRRPDLRRRRRASGRRGGARRGRRPDPRHRRHRRPPRPGRRPARHGPRPAPAARRPTARAPPPGVVDRGRPVPPAPDARRPEQPAAVGRAPRRARHPAGRARRGGRAPGSRHHHARRAGRHRQDQARRRGGPFDHGRYVVRRGRLVRRAGVRAHRGRRVVRPGDRPRTPRGVTRPVARARRARRPPRPAGPGQPRAGRRRRSRHRVAPRPRDPS